MCWVLRSLGSAGVVALARACAWAGAAWFASATGEGVRVAGSFLLTWTLVFLIVQLPLALLELPLQTGLQPRESPARARAALAAGVLGLGWGLLGCWLLVFVRALGVGGVLAGAVWGALAAAALPPAGQASRRWSFAGVLLIMSAVGALVLANPEGRYAQRYAENHLSEAELAAEPPFPERDPASLSERELAQALARTWMRTHPPAALRWSWEEAVCLEGLLACGAPGARDYLLAWARAHREEALHDPLWADACAPLAPLIAAEPLPADLAPGVVRVEEYVRAEAPRTRAGAVSHVGLLLGGLLPPQAWVDSLFMHGVFLNRRLRQGDEVAGEEARRLGLAMLTHLQDPERGLLRHAYLELGPLGQCLPVESCFWARGNGWAAYFLVDHQLARAAQGLPREPILQQGLERLTQALLELQDAGGLWRTDLTGPPAQDNLPETSASALFLCAFRRARRGGLLEPNPAACARAAVALRARVRWDRGHPTLEGTSTGTSAGFRAAYRAVPQDDNVGHGVGAVLLAFSAGD